VQTELDLSETASIRGVVDRAWAALGRIDVVVKLTHEQVRHQIDTNLVGSPSQIIGRLRRRPAVALGRA
jgi:NAD(P)-dependent dehydrogenase (short-subunit alcohol dehydrogenase family)